MRRLAGSASSRDAAKRQRLRGAFAAAALRSVAISPTALGELFFADPSVKSHHVAVGGSAGQLTVADECTLEAVFSAQVGVLAIGDIKYRRAATYVMEFRCGHVCCAFFSFREWDQSCEGPFFL